MHSNLPHLPITRFSASSQPAEMSSFGETFSASVPLFRLEGVRPREMTTTSPNANSTLPVLPSCQPLGTPACHHQSELDEASAAPTAAKLRPCRSCPFLHAAGNSQSPLRVSVGSQSPKGPKNVKYVNPCRGRRVSTLVHHAMLISCANDLCFLIRTVRNTCAMSVLLISSVTSPSPKKLPNPSHSKHIPSQQMQCRLSHRRFFLFSKMLLPQTRLKTPA
ncbi:hypothetical protein BKA56DRAFT_74377 [Ilyonectria sp. MPI-CAGE-AT-0026]|nr:hypothetical protein BKA56DRAFT_74377 [Ilyonectria sp. MPI-CAGE-AT-0026]